MLCGSVMLVICICFILQSALVLVEEMLGSEQQNTSQITSCLQCRSGLSLSFPLLVCTLKRLQQLDVVPLHETSLSEI